MRNLLLFLGLIFVFIWKYTFFKYQKEFGVSFWVLGDGQNARSHSVYRARLRSRLAIFISRKNQKRSPPVMQKETPNSFNHDD